MAEDDYEDSDRTEEPTPEKREEFRQKGQIAQSKELSQVFVFVSVIFLLTFYLPIMISKISSHMKHNFRNLSKEIITSESFFTFFQDLGVFFILLVLPIFFVNNVIATIMTFFQTRFNFAFNRLKPDFKRLNPIKGFTNMVNSAALMNLFKSIGKLFAVGFVTYLILYSEIFNVAALVFYELQKSWAYWGTITLSLFWSVSCLLLLIAAVDYFYGFSQIEKKLRMTKKELKEDFKKREVDPHVKGKMRKMARDLSFAKIISETKNASVLITNPTHFAIAIKYNSGMKAPIVLAKGKDYIALKMKEVAKEHDIPMVENKPLARTLYKMVESGMEIPEEFYKAIAEVIRYIFRIKGKF